MFYLAIIGSREFWNKKLLFDTIDECIKQPTTIVSGGARGADTLAKEYANLHHLNIIEYLPDWSIGKHAGFIRNRKIIEKADYVIACLVEGLPCRGTRHSISLASELNKPTMLLSTKQRPPIIRTPHIPKGL